MSGQSKSDSKPAITRSGGIGSAPLPSLPRISASTRVLHRALRGRVRERVRQISHLLGALELALQVKRERRDLLAMDERTLKDLGLNGVAYREASRPFWDVPRERLSQ
jgi:uncharacterized protein YjiS (DUF1127 family)